MKQGYRKKSDKHKGIAGERIQELFRQAELRFCKNPELSDRYVEIARKIAMKYRVRMPSSLKKRFCKHCHAFLKPGSNCRIRLNKGKVVYYCLGCKGFMRFPYKQKG